MLKFFRNIRRTLLSDNKTGKYFKYAIGEVILVMVGILLALQVNNWNEDRKLRKIENDLLYNIYNNLVESKNNLENNILFNQNTLEAYHKIKKYVDKGIEYDETLDSAFSFMTFWSAPEFTQTAYETLKAKGIEIIKNDSIKNTITEVFEQIFPFVITEVQTEWELHNSLVLPFVGKNIQYLDRKTARPNNYKNLINSDEFKNLMGLKIMTREFTIQFSEMALSKVDSLINILRREIE
jgi:hypothetical protein